MERLTGYMGSTPLTHPLSFQILDLNTNPGNMERTLILLNLRKARDYPSDTSCCCCGRSQTWRRPLAASLICVSLHHTIGRSKREEIINTNKHNISPMATPNRTFLSPCPPPPNPSTRPPPTLPTTSIVSIVNP